MLDRRFERLENQRGGEGRDLHGQRFRAPRRSRSPARPRISRPISVRRRNSTPKVHRRQCLRQHVERRQGRHRLQRKTHGQRIERLVDRLHGRLPDLAEQIERRQRPQKPNPRSNPTTMKEVKNAAYRAWRSRWTPTPTKLLAAYLDSLKKSYGDTADGAEIVADIEGASPS